MWKKCFLILVYSHLCTADKTQFRQSTNGGFILQGNSSRVVTPDYNHFQFQVNDQPKGLHFNASVLQAQISATNSTKGKKISAQTVACPGTFTDLLLQYLTVDVSDSSAFQTQELPPFLQPRFSGGPGNNLIKEYIKATFSGLGWTVEEDTSIQSTPLGFIQFTSVITTFNPQYAKRLVLACHFDSKFTPSGFIGAVDGAVSCALLVDLAKRLNDFLQHTIGAPMSIQMIFFDGKEPYVNFSPTDSLYGSRQLSLLWANTLDPLDATKNKLGNINTFILLSVLGHAETQFEQYYTEGDDVFTELLSFEVCLALKNFGVRALPLTRLLFTPTRRSFEIYDDQVPFRQKGVTNIAHLVTYPFPVQWHTLQDNADIVDYTVVEDLNRILRVYIANFVSQVGAEYIDTGFIS